MNERPSWDDYFMELAFAVSKRATCPRASVGAVVVKDNRILGCGYNGSPSGEEHCSEVGCYVVSHHCVRTIHGETNAILDALQRGSIRGATVYCTHRPCLRCLQLMKQVGIVRCYYSNDHLPVEEERDLWNSLDIQSEQWYRSG